MLVMMLVEKEDSKPCKPFLRCLIEVLVGGPNYAYVVVEHNLGGQL